MTRQSDNSLLIIDTTSKTVSDIVPLAGIPQAVAVTPDSGRVLVTYETSEYPSAKDSEGYVAIIDVHTLAITTVRLGKYARDIAVDPTDGKAYIAGFLDGLFLVDISHGTVVRTLSSASDPRSVTISPDGRSLYTTSLEKNIEVVDAETGTVNATVPIDDIPAAVAVSPNGSRLYVTYGYFPGLEVIDVARRAAADTVMAGEYAYAVAVTREGQKVYATKPEQDSLAVLDAAGEQLDTVAVGDDPVALSVGTDGRIYVVNSEQGTLSIMAPAD